MWEPTTASAANRDEDPKNQKQQVDCSEIDSGFLSSEQILSGYSDSDYLDEAKREATSATLSVDRPRDNNIGEKQVEYLDSGLVESGVIEEDNKMLLERALDHGLSEWMCTLELGQHQTQQINNLSRKVDELSMSESAEEGHTMGRDRSRETVVEVPEEEQPWEVFYKQDAEGDTYLHIAVSEGAAEIVRDVIRITPHPCLLDIQNDLLQSPLHLAVLTSNGGLVRMLLLAGAETSIRDKYGNTPLHLACAAGDLECVRALTERITATEEVEAVNCTGVLISKKKGVDVTEEEEQVTTVNRPRAIQYADVELRNYDGERCVHIAVMNKNKHVDMMRQLVVRSGADVNAREGRSGYTPLHLAVGRGDKDLVKLLLEECSNLNLEVASYGRSTAFQIASVNRNQELMQMLRNKGAEALDVSSSEDSDDSDFDDNEVSF